MKLFLHQVLSSLLLLLVVVESSNELNITKGSSLSTNSPNNVSVNNTYWLSPSGNIAFGFYPTGFNSSSQFIVGIWFVKSANKTLVWTANVNDPPLNHPSSIVFNNDGKLVLQYGNGREKLLLPDMSESASSAGMLDNGNFILYSSDSKIIWESFSHPTNTILGGQTLKSEQSLISSVFRFDGSYGTYELLVQQKEGIPVIYEVDAESETREIYKISLKNNKQNHDSPISLNLDTTGRLYLVNWDGLVLNNITEGEKEQQEQQDGSKVRNNEIIYRATLETDGIIYLYKESIGIESEVSTLL